MTDTLICHFVAYQSDADLDINYDDGMATVDNHDELVNDGRTFDEIRALADTEHNRSFIAEESIIDPGDSMWRDKYADMEVGDSVKLIE